MADKNLAESHRRQFEGEDYQAVAIDLAERTGRDYEDFDSSPDPECGCGFCEGAEWVD